MTRILIIDPDTAAAAALQYRLQESGFWVDVESDGIGSIVVGMLKGYSLLIVDPFAEPVNALEALRRFRARSTLPLLVLTSRSDEADLIAGLEGGADDYVVKPGRPREVVARVRALLRRFDTAPGAAVDVLKSGRLTMWPAQRRAEWQGQPIKLTSTEFSLLEILLREVGRPVSKTQLSQYALGRPPARYERSIDVHLCSVRRKLGQLSDGRPLIQAVHLHGYQLHKE